MVELSHDHVSIQAVCYEKEIIKYEGWIKLNGAVVESDSNLRWEDEGTLILNLRKENSPSYWPLIIEGTNGMEVGTWTKMAKQFKDELEDYIKTD